MYGIEQVGKVGQVDHIDSKHRRGLDPRDRLHLTLTCEPKVRS